MCGNTTVVINGAGPVGLTTAIALLDVSSQMGIPMPKVQIWDPCLRPWREVVIRIPHSIAVSLPEQVQMELWGETTASPQRVFVRGQCNFDITVENSRVHDSYSEHPSRYTAIVQVKHFQEACLSYLRMRHAQHCTINEGTCPPGVMREAAAVIQSYGKAARKSNPISGNLASQEDPCHGMSTPSPHGLFVLFNRDDVMDGVQDTNYRHFNSRYNGFATFQSHRRSNTVQTYIWPEEVNNDMGLAPVPASHEELLANGRSLSLRALFDCVPQMQGEEDWWWELSRRCRLQDQDGKSVAPELACTLEWRRGCSGHQTSYPQMDAKACSPAFHAWFDAVRYQISLNLYKMGIFGSCAESFLKKVRLCYARREPYRYNSVYTEVESVPLFYIGDSAGSTDFKKGLSCGRGLLCAAQLAFDVGRSIVEQMKKCGQADLKHAFQCSGRQYQQAWNSSDMMSEWRDDFDPTHKYLLTGRL